MAETDLLTLETRLAALEAKMAQLTDTRPTTYYTHQYSGEEIDAATGRALTGGALDTSVTNVSNQLGTFVRPNLLDNWYFGNPVDQRGGMLQLAGTMLYSDAACTQAMFGSTKTTSIVKVSNVAAHPIDDSTVYVKLADCVRGYTGNGYAVDRWCFDTDSGSCVLALTNDGVKFIATAGATGIASLKQDIDPTMLSTFAGKTVTLSILGKTDISQQVLFYVNNQVAAVNSAPAVSGVCMVTLTYTFPAVLTGAAIFVYGRSYSGAGEGTILAAKLELGPTQTLAHQENGKWVLNEVPEYGGQLARCQRYFARLSGDSAWSVVGIARCDGSNNAMLVFWLPVPMRTRPSIVASGLTVNAVAVTSITADQYNPTCLKYNGTLAANVPVGIYVIEQYGSGYVDVSADL